MREPDTRYARTQDGAHLAFQVVGEGTHDIVLTAGLIPTESFWDEPDLADAMDRLAAVARLVLFDPRGFGGSDAFPDGRLSAPEESMTDIATVMDAAGSQKAFLFKTDNIASTVLFATTWPERVSGMLLLNGYARLARSPDYPIGVPDDLIRQYLGGAESNNRESAFELMCRSRVDDERFRRWFLKAYRRATPPRAALTHVRHDFATDARHVLPLVQVPTLVLHSADDPYVRAEHGRYLAERIPGALYSELPGAGHNLATTALERVVDEVIEFVTGVPSAPRVDRVFATVLFTDIVDSTALAVRMGDARWRALLDEHDALIDRQLTRFGGRLVNRTGDGVVATFDGPARAVSCATATRDGLRRLDLEIRVGIHAGEVSARGDDVSGIAVHVASRVQARATAGQILTTRTVVDLVAGSGLEFDQLDEVELKGVPGQWRLYAVHP